ncbi:MAG: hypothetical protein CML29_15460 [Rhizobiales bacterium]|nr:hypothetical protein [Hyphomicrobiales bacterium]MBA69299.1 hypothetical protein [Hyphomicrobiales bacterium]|tara:strand:+ start:150 stop:515 length:366 start_codon:yes stop_codon:yes gene_type:complete
MPSLVAKPAIRTARRLRHVMTEGERKLWDELREFRRLYGIHVRRQVPIGDYVVDFAIHSAKLVIEVDGHFHEDAERKMKDAVRDRWLEKAGYKVLRFRTGELADSYDGCIHEILDALGVLK